MRDAVFEIARDARGSLVHVRRRDDGECMGCIEIGLYEILRSMIVNEERDTRGATAELRSALPITP